MYDLFGICMVNIPFLAMPTGDTLLLYAVLDALPVNIAYGLITSGIWQANQLLQLAVGTSMALGAPALAAIYLYGVIRLSQQIVMPRWIPLVSGIIRAVVGNGVRLTGNEFFNRGRTPSLYWISHPLDSAPPGPL